MSTRKVLAVTVVLAGLLFSLQSPPRLTAQDAPPPPGPPADQSLGQPTNQPPDDNDAQQPDPPGRVARLGNTTGSVSFQPGGEGDWVTAVPNRPITTGDNLWADQNSRGELEIGSTSIRINSETSVTFLDLDDHTTQLRLSLGTIAFRVRHLDDEDHFEVDTPNLAFVVQAPGEYRIDVNEAGSETDTVVWHGRGEATGGGASYDVVAGQNARFTGTDQLDHEIAQIPANDDFDSWAFDRDDHEDKVESSNYVSSEMTGSEDLDEYGQWSYQADYGPVWTPAAVAPGWAPYRFGHWVWVRPWGWTWVEDEPWGFAPFHYGRWAFGGASWFWVPGPLVVRPVFAPALVAFVGGGGFGVGVGFGAGVAWFPLGPREVFVPWYHTSRIYVNNVNITNARIGVTEVDRVYAGGVHATYANQHVTNAVTAVSHDTFVNARSANTNMVHVDEKQIANAPVERNLAIQPTKASTVGAGKPASAKPPAAAVSRPVVATRMPAAAHTAGAATPVRTETPQPHTSASTAHPQSSAPRPAAGNNGLVKTAPPVQENAQRQQSEAQKFRNWQQQKKATPRPQRTAPSHEDK